MLTRFTLCEKAVRNLSIVILSFSLIAKAATNITCDGLFHWVDVPTTQCMDGTPTGFEYACRVGLREASPLLIYVDGGGACWDFEMCNCEPDASGKCAAGAISRTRFGRANSDEGKTPEQSEIFSFPPFSGPTSIFDSNWNLVRVPYCTGDVHIGDRVVTYAQHDRFIEVHHKGYSNLIKDIAEIKSRFAGASKIVFWGTSAGGLGVDCNLSNVRNTWPTAPMFEFNNAGPPFGPIHTPDVPEVTRRWGVWEPRPGGGINEKTCPIQATSGASGKDWSMSFVLQYNKIHIANVRKALTEDYSDSTAVDFAAALGGSDRAVENTLNSLFTDVIDGNANYKVYYHTGTCHDEREQNGNSAAGCNFNTMHQKGVPFHDWVSAWLGRPSPVAWDNVR